MSGRGDALRLTWRITRPGMGVRLASLGLASLSLMCAIGLIATSAWLISRASEQPPILYLTVAVVSVRAFGIGRGFFRYSERLVSHSGALTGLTKLRTAIVDRIAITAPTGTREVSKGDALRTVIDDVDTVAEYGLRTLLPTATAVTVGVIVIALTAWLLPLAAVVLLAGLLTAGVLSPLVTAAATRNANLRTINLRGLYSSTLSQTLSTLDSQLATNRIEDAVENLNTLQQRLADEESRTAQGLGAATAIGIAAQGFSLIAMVFVTVPAVTNGSLPGVDLAVLMLLPLIAFEMVIGLPAAAVAKSRAQQASVRTAALLDQPDYVPDPVIPAPSSLISSAPVLAVHDLAVHWPGNPEPAIEQVNFELQGGEKLAIIGPSGCGKSSIAAALMRFVPITGAITLDGLDYGELTGDQVRRSIALCEQDPYIFDNTIAENIRFARPDATNEDVEKAARRAGMSEWLDALPQGIAARVGEHGNAVSGGQRQRIGLARILLCRAPIVILDEPTEHLDPAMAESLIENILDALADRTVILITHQPHGLSRMTRQLVLSNPMSQASATK